MFIDKRKAEKICLQKISTMRNIRGLSSGYREIIPDGSKELQKYQNTRKGIYVDKQKRVLIYKKKIKSIWIITYAEVKYMK